MAFRKNNLAEQPEDLSDIRGNGIALAERNRGREHFENDDKTSRKGAYIFSIALFAIAFALAFLVARAFLGLWISLAIGLVAGLLSILSIHMTLQWEQAVILRFGKLNRIAGPGVVLTVPLIEYVTIRVDRRMRCTFFEGEQILTADLVPVDVNAVFFWTVWDVSKASTEVENYSYAVSNTAQACMRDVIGSMEIDELATRRSKSTTISRTRLPRSPSSGAFLLQT